MLSILKRHPLLKEAKSNRNISEVCFHFYFIIVVFLLSKAKLVFDIFISFLQASYDSYILVSNIL